MVKTVQKYAFSAHLIVQKYAFLMHLIVQKYAFLLEKKRECM